MKPSEIFTPTEIQMIHKALQITLGENPVIPNKVFHTLTGATVEQGLSVLAAWPNVDIDGDPEWWVLWGVCGSLRNYPLRQNEHIFRESGLRKEDLHKFMETLRPIKPI